jgi:predicted acyl esterase
MFVVKLVDVYADGYEALVRESAGQARYQRGLEQGDPIEKGKAYALTLNLWSTALVFNQGHRIASTSSLPTGNLSPCSPSPLPTRQPSPPGNGP